jgi:hypothetical protein
MKHLKLTLMACALAVSATSCQAKGLITQDDAKAVGKVLADHALDIVNDAVSGQKIDIKLVATEAGLDVANLAFKLASEKISAASFTNTASAVLPVSRNDLVNQEAERIVAEALNHAKSQVELTLTNQQDASFAGQVLNGSAGFAIAALDAK